MGVLGTGPVSKARVWNIALERGVSRRLYGGVVGLMSGGGVGWAGLAGWCSLGCLLLTGHSRVYKMNVSG